MRHPQLILSLIICLSFGSTAFAEKLCANVFAPFVVTAEVQKHIDATILDLAHFRIALDVSMAKGKDSVEFATLKANYTSKEKELARFLEEKSIMSHSDLQDRIKFAIRGIQVPLKRQTRKEKAIRENHIKVVNHSQYDGAHIRMNKVKPGVFQMGKSGRTKATEITKPFEMAATLITQIVWKKVIDISMKYYGIDSSFRPFPSKSIGDLKPVESISYFEALDWIENLNSLSRDGVPELAEIIPDFQKGDRFRFATEAEWEFVARGRGQNQTEEYLPNNYRILNVHEWHKQNSDGPMPVAQKSPLVVDGVPFFDILGNVREFVADKYTMEIPGGVDPVVHPDVPESNFVARGGSWDLHPEYNTPHARNSVTPTESRDDIGFRLVREVRP